ncbi:MAG: DUF721 domain-containing protein [Polyangiales bacterium]
MAGKRRRTPNATPTRLGDLVQRTEPGKAAAQRVLSRAVWEEVAGVGFARRTKPGRIHRGTLFVIVASSGWAQELALVEKVVIDRLLQRGIEIERLRYEVGDVEAPDRGGVYAPPRSEVEVARKTALPDDAANALGKVRDPGLREVMAKAARAAARRKAVVEVEEKARGEQRAIPRLPGESFPQRGSKPK